MSTPPQDNAADEYARQFMPPRAPRQVGRPNNPQRTPVEETVAVAEAPPEPVEEIAEAPAADCRHLR